MHNSFHQVVQVGKTQEIYMVSKIKELERIDLGGLGLWKKLLPFVCFGKKGWKGTFRFFLPFWCRQFCLRGWVDPKILVAREVVGCRCGCCVFVVAWESAWKHAAVLDDDCAFYAVVVVDFVQRWHSPGGSCCAAARWSDTPRYPSRSHRFSCTRHRRSHHASLALTRTPPGCPGGGWYRRVALPRHRCRPTYLLPIAHNPLLASASTNPTHRISSSAPPPTTPTTTATTRRTSTSSPSASCWYLHCATSSSLFAKARRGRVCSHVLSHLSYEIAF